MIVLIDALDQWLSKALMSTQGEIGYLMDIYSKSNILRSGIHMRTKVPFLSIALGRLVQPTGGSGLQHFSAHFRFNDTIVSPQIDT